MTGMLVCHFCFEGFKQNLLLVVGSKDRCFINYLFGACLRVFIDTELFVLHSQMKHERNSKINSISNNVAHCCHLGSPKLAISAAKLWHRLVSSGLCYSFWSWDSILFLARHFLLIQCTKRQRDETLTLARSLWSDKWDPSTFYECLQTHSFLNAWDCLKSGRCVCPQALDKQPCVHRCSYVHQHNIHAWVCVQSQVHNDMWKECFHFSYQKKP